MSQTTTVILESPLARGDTAIEIVELRRPKAGELRGANLADLLQMDVGTLMRVIPRISEPALTEPECAALDPADLVQIGGAIAAFLLPKAASTPSAPA